MKSALKIRYDAILRDNKYEGGLEAVQKLTKAFMELGTAKTRITLGLVIESLDYAADTISLKRRTDMANAVKDVAVVEKAYAES